MFSDVLTGSLPLTIYACAIAAIFGAVFGSFFNCMAWRIVHGESVLHGRSHCASCGHPLGPADLVPIFSYLALKGRCRYCGQKIAPRYAIVEGISAGGFALTVLRFGLSARTPVVLAAFCLLLTLSLVDLDSYLIPDRFLVALALLWALALPGLSRERPFFYEAEDGSAGLLSGGLLGLQGLGAAYLHGVLGGLILGGGMLLVSLLFDRLTGKESLGGGDIKLFFCAGLFLGPGVGLLCLFLSSIIGLVFAAVRRGGRIPFGPAISLSFFLCLLWGRDLVSAYLALFL